MKVIISDAINGTSGPAADPFEALTNVMAFSARDWAACREDAWLYGIVMGWGSALPDVAARHGWDAATSDRLRSLRAKYCRRLRASRRGA